MMKKYVILALVATLVMLSVVAFPIGSVGALGTAPATTDTTTTTVKTEPTYYADYADTTAYVHAKTPYVVICRVLNVRSTPSTAKTPIEKLQRGEIVYVLDITDGWAKIETLDGTSAYVFAKYIQPVQQ